ncbi:protein bicaudal D isoform X2 [Bombus vosnesenskii]|uniref:Protein bicaudal D isoform X2 n=3 Tax=Pyrobombus TaxID=144703 RepID=A0A6J3KGI0_9HYME|nr:protein bicaudal D isoform X2 [Bombus impatiens]XP_033194106.1 protein bicaudal D isoform X2 [Bombus vancouverensis nearcticus]XP_033304502.1 protein bicaudal D isoform X2 [Bombus bifarius]XP_033351054.1 protein bicaudal D isoform X2 [Bombus vosnesenskii]XP_050474998.1 protein bicaudal D isoform X2 [Bombus huntii]
MATTEGVTIEELRIEIERLSRELDLASTEKIQSAQYGLALLEEKSALQQRCNDLEALYENTKHELEITQEALAKFQTTTKLTTKSGIEQEETLLNESAARETSLQTQIIELENEAKQLRHELELVQAERDHALQEREEVGKDHQQAEAERKSLRTMLRECRFREARLLQDYSELEDENISLQKQVSGLRSSQVEFEGAKHEIRRLTEEVELLNSQVEELTNLKKIAEKQMEEALESLQAEREAKYALKKELDQRINSDSIYNLSNLALSIRGITEDQTICSDGEDDSPALRRIEADLKTQEPGTSATDKQVDLFSEIHLNELKKLEKQLELAESEKAHLTQNLRESQYAVEKSQNELQSFVARIVQLAAHVQSLHHLHSKLPEKQTEETTLDKLNQAIMQYHQWSTMSAREVNQLQKDLADLENGLTISDSTQQLRTELTNLRNKIPESEKSLREKLLDTEQRSVQLESDISILSKLAVEAGGFLDSAQNDLQNISDELAQLYHHVCTVNGEIPSRVVLDHEKIVPEKEEENGKIEWCRTLFKTDIQIKDLESLSKAKEVAKHIETAMDQIKHLRSAVEHTIELSKVKGMQSNVCNVCEGSVNENKAEVADLQEQVIRLKALLSAKREQIATLRTVLKSNKNTAEVALTNLKGKYENEKSIVNETMLKLRNELRMLKENAATFSSLRAMFAARCEEYVTQVDELQRQLAAAEDDRKTLNSLLRLAVQQKLVLTMKLEELEVDRELRNTRRHATSANGRGRMRMSQQTNRPHLGRDFF